MARTINTGNFTSTKVDVTLEAEVEKGDSVDEVLKSLNEKLYAEVGKEEIRWGDPDKAIKILRKYGEETFVNEHDKTVKSVNRNN